MKQWYVLDVNPVPWAVGPLSVGKKAGGGVYPKMGRNQELFSYQEAVRATLIQRYPSLLKFEGEHAGSLFGDAPVELCLFFFKKLEISPTASGRIKVGKAPDCTNMVKATEDAVAKILFDNDVQVMAQRNVIVQRAKDVPEGIVVISIENWSGMDPDELPSHVWADINEINAETLGYGPEQLELFQ